MSTCVILMPSLREVVHELDEARDRVGERRGLRQLLADVAVDADDVRARCGSAASREQPARLGHRDAELVLLEAGRDVRVRLGIDVGIDADRDRARACRRDCATRSSTASSSPDSTLKQPMPASSAIFISASVLPTPENTT